jgi:hypothetical protein
MNTFLHDFLLLKTANIDYVLQIVRSVSTPLLSLTFMMGAVFEKLGGQNFIGLFKRLIIALFLISFGSTILKSSVHLSFDISARILTSAEKTNPVVQLIKRARKLSKSPTTKKSSGGLIEKAKTASAELWESTAFVTKLLLDDGLSSVIFVISYSALLLLGQFYTIIFNFTYVSIPIIATLIVFPPTYSVANSISRTVSWVFLMPIFTMITILLLSTSFAFPQDGVDDYYFTSFENLINFCIMAIMLLLVPTIVSGFLSGAGILTAAETFTKTTAMAAATGGKALVIKGARSIAGQALFGKNYGLATMGKVGVNRGLDRLGNKSIEARNRLQEGNRTNSQSTASQNQEGVSLSASTTQGKTSIPGSISSGQSTSSKSSFISRALDRSIVASDSVLNFKKNHMASRAVKADLGKINSSPPREARSSLFNTYKQQAHKDSRLVRPIDYKVSNLRSQRLKKNTLPHLRDNDQKATSFERNKSKRRYV